MPPVPTKGESYATITLRVAPNTSFEELTKVMHQVLTLPKLPGFGGCQPCFSGLDRFVFENPEIRQ